MIAVTILYRRPGGRRRRRERVVRARWRQGVVRRQTEAALQRHRAAHASVGRADQQVRGRGDEGTDHRCRRRRHGSKPLDDGDPPQRRVLQGYLVKDVREGQIPAGRLPGNKWREAGRLHAAGAALCCWQRRRRRPGRCSSVCQGRPPHGADSARE